MADTLALPLRVTGGRLATLEQGTTTEVSQSVALLLATRPGERRSVPDYGLPDPLFSGLDTDLVARTVQEWEDRADYAVIEQVTAGVTDTAHVTVLPTQTTGGV